MGAFQAAFKFASGEQLVCSLFVVVWLTFWWAINCPPYACCRRALWGWKKINYIIPTKIIKTKTGIKMNKIKLFIYVFLVHLLCFITIALGIYMFLSLRLIIEFYNKFGEINSNINYLLVEFFLRLFDMETIMKIIFVSLFSSILTFLRPQPKISLSQLNDDMLNSLNRRNKR